ncbi:sodium-dependent transporter [Dethiobacter alkaliphilus]|uniref:sodium-dependent transporter n=1 Tax=Dethiobacter alkaliphilus TaxID=427926 RepID=UPI002225B7D8|nr:sodium-dependent transporter [Dethiobacter alkaliphilus]MCW3490962.1 sodium-dependent transporter [Dethiobacter alkaliphilus]
MSNEREQWVSRIGFILAAAGSAIGLGNIWRFPHVTGTEGGAVFVLIYLITTLLIGYPLLNTEVSIGRKTQRNPVGAFKALAPNTPWWLVGALGVFTGFIILSYYSVVAGWAMSYTAQSLGGLYAPGTDYVDTFVGHISQVWEPILWHFLFMLITVGVIAAGVVKGIQRTVKILMPMLFILFVALIVRSLTLPGAGAGVAFYLQPDFSQVTGQTFLSAIAQAFFTLSLGMGALITYGSYLKQNEDVSVDSGWVVGLDTGIALLAGFAIFPAVFALGFDPDGGAGLAFMTLPAVFAEMPMGQLFGFLFFLLLSVAALTSAISLLEVVVAWVIDEHGWSRRTAAVVLGGLIFLLGIPSVLGFSAWSGITFQGMDILDTFDWFANSIFLPLGGLLTAIFAGYVWGNQKVMEEANCGKDRQFLCAWYAVSIKYIIPIAIAVVMVWGLYETFFG